MLLHYVKLAVRLLIRKPFFTFINALGLSVGFGVFYILSQHSAYELRSDQFHRDYERIYRVYFDLYLNSGVDWSHFVSGASPPVFTSLVKNKITEIESATRIIHQRNFDQVRWAGPHTDTAGWMELNPKVVISTISKHHEKRSFLEENTIYADPNLFEFFSITILKGSPGEVLSAPDAAVLSSSTARKYFGENNPIGRIITLGESESFTVTGVFEDLPSNSHLRFDLVLSTLHIQYAIENVHPFVRSAQNYFKIRKGVSVSEVEKMLNEEQEKHWDFEESFPGSTLTFFLQPLKEAPFRVFDNDVFTAKTKYIPYAFRAVAIIVLVMAWINYLNLQLSTQAGRMKELAARKTAGASRVDFVKQFLVESLLINCMALLIALTLIQLLASPLETLFMFHVPAWNEITASSIAVFLMAMASGIFIAGFQPAFSVWRMTIDKNFRYARLPKDRNNFVDISTVFQFVSAIALIIWFFSVSTQVQLIIKDTWGVDRHLVVVVELPSEVPTAGFLEGPGTLKNELLLTAGIDDVALSTTVAGDLVDNPVGFNRTDTAFWIVSKSDGGVDERFIPFYRLKLLAGRNFLPDNPADKRSVILSREAAKCAGFDPDNAIGKILHVGRYPWRPFGTDAEIIGVIEDHRHNPLYNESGINNSNKGTILTYGNHLFPKNKPMKMSVRLNGQNIQEVIERIGNKYRAIFPDQLFHWYFLNDHMNAHYKNETIVRNQILLFTFIAIGIACLGLVGAMSNKVVNKTKEIGIRKVLGATIGQIVSILINTTIKQITIATIIGIPLAYYLTDQYLQKFSDRISLQWWHFFLPIALITAIMLFTIASVLWRAIARNPIEALRYE